MRSLSPIAVCLLAAPVAAAPALPEKPPRWEYAELTYRSTPRPPIRDDDGGPTAQTISIRWTTGAGEIEATSWADLAEKIKAPAIKKDSSATLQRIQMLNHLGSEGWELMEPPGVAAVSSGSRGFARGNAWLFKRRAP